MPVSENNRFAVIGTVQEVIKHPYGEGKIRAEVRIGSQGFIKDDVPEAVPVVFTCFGKSSDVAQEAKPGDKVAVTGYLQSREYQGKFYSDFRVVNFRVLDDTPSPRNTPATQDIPF